jgi:hypothetical protein
MSENEHFGHYKKGVIIEPENLTKPYLLKYMEKINNREETVRKL